MPAPAPFPSPFPALYLYPLNDSFIPKHIALLHNQHVKIGRQTNAKTTPGERNGYFDSKVLSRQHAEVWEEGNKIFIKDVKSSNGTFINGERLSPEGLESDPYELKSDDIVEFGIDIVGEDNKTIVHHKVAARVVCIFTEQDAQMAARAEQHQMQHMQQFAGPSSSMSPTSNGPMMNQAGPSSGPGANNNSNNSNSSFNFSGQQPPRRPQMSQQGISGMGGMGASMRPPGKSGLTFDHILNRLQGELQKSRETGAELHTLTGAMNEIHDTLGGGNLPATAPPFPHSLPPVRPPQTSQSPPSQSEPLAPPPEQESSSNEPLVASTTATNFQSPSSSNLLGDLQTQLKDTQASLSQHIDKIRALEDALKEQEAIRQEVRLLRDMMDAVQRRQQPDMSSHKPRRQATLGPREGFDIDEDDEGDDDFDDDTQSVGTAVPHELERVDEEDEESAMTADDEPIRDRVDELELEMATRVADDHPSTPNGIHDGEFEDSEMEEEQRLRRQELGRPRTPEPSHLGMSGRDGFDSRTRSKTLTSPSPSLSNSVVDDLTTRLTTLSVQLESALALSSTLQAQHSTAQSTISALESKVEALENLVTATLSAQQRQPSPPPVITPELSEQIVSRNAERESLTSMVTEWKKSVEGQWSNVQEEWNQERERLSRAREEWENKVRLVDDGLERMERMQKVALSKDTPHFHGNGDVKHGLVTPPSPRSLSSDSNRSPRRKRSGSGRGRTGSRKRGSSRDADTDDTEATLASEEGVRVLTGKLVDPASVPLSDHPQDKTVAWGLATPAPSVDTGHHFEDQSLVPNGSMSDENKNRINMQTAFGVLVLSVAAAAVVWRVKPANV